MPPSTRRSRSRDTRVAGLPVQCRCIYHGTAPTRSIAVTQTPPRLQPLARSSPRQADRRRHAHRPRAPQGRRPGSGAVVLLRRAGLRADAALRQPGGLPVGRRLPPPHRPQHLGKPRRQAAAARQHRPLSHGHPVSHAGSARRRAAARAGGRHRARRRQRPRRQRGALPARLRPERRRAVLGQAARAVAGRRRWPAQHGHPAPRPE